MHGCVRQCYEVSKNLLKRGVAKAMSRKIVSMKMTVGPPNTPVSAIDLLFNALRHLNVSLFSNFLL